METLAAITTFVFTDIEGSTRLWDTVPQAMGPALARHDALCERVVEAHRGAIVKMTGDGMHAVFGDPLDALRAATAFQIGLAELTEPDGIALLARCGVHAGVDEQRGKDFFGTAVNRAARIMCAAHGGQILLSEVVANLVKDRLPEGVSLRDLGAVRLRDLANPERLFQIVHAGLRDGFPALHALDKTPNNLPQQTAAFIGRENEVDEVKRLLQEHRLITLIGTGGLGKTRLALQVAAEVQEDYPDGVWLVELAPLSDGHIVPQAVASALGITAQPGTRVADTVIEFVRSRTLLIVLDNCEHLVGECAAFATRLLQAGSQVRILATSREHLRVAGECNYTLRPLAIPAPAEAITLDDLEDYEATRLFMARAYAADSSFSPTPRNAAAIAEICRRLDGIPLAIELAAVRVKAMSVEKIAERLSDRFRLLTSGDRTALPRQQTLRALIDWSYDLLTERERILLRRLSVFAGGWTLEVAEAVGAGGGLESEEVLDLTTNLVDKSLVSLDAGRERCRCLETVRQYARERLDESGEAEAAKNRHLAFYVNLAEKAKPGLMGPEQGYWLALLDAERENLLVAHAWCDYASDGATLGLRLLSSIKLYFANAGLLELGHRLLVEALARGGAKGATPERCRALRDVGQFGCFMGRYEEARGDLEESLAIARQLGDRAAIAGVLQPLGMASLGQGDLPAAHRHFDEALALAQKLENPRELAAALNAVAQVRRMEGFLHEAERLYRQGLELSRNAGDLESVAIGLLNLSMVSIARGSRAEARDMLIEVFAIVDQIGSMAAGQNALEVVASLAAEEADFETAALLFGAAAEQATQIGMQHDPSDASFLSPRRRRVGEALCAELYAEAENAGRALNGSQAKKMATAWLRGE